MLEELPAVNRAALIVRMRKPFVDWLMAASEASDAAQERLKPGSVSADGDDSKNVYLIPEFEDMSEYEKFLRENFRVIFENELFDWYADPEMWPGEMTWELFTAWFECEVDTMVYDMFSEEKLECGD
jgi:hypothetical protein